MAEPDWLELEAIRRDALVISALTSVPLALVAAVASVLIALTVGGNRYVDVFGDTMAGPLSLGSNALVDATRINGKAVPFGDFVGATDVQTLTGKTLISPVMQNPVLEGTVKAGTGLTMPGYIQGGPIVFPDNTYDIGQGGDNRPRSIFAGTAFLAPDGSPTTPTFAFADQPTVGLFAGPNRMYAAADGLMVRKLLFGSADYQTVKAAIDSGDELGAIAIRNGDIPQSFSIYGRYLDPSTYHRVRLFWNDQLELHLLMETSGPGMPEGKGLDIGSRQGEVNFWTGGPGGPDYQLSATAFRPLYATADPDLGSPTTSWGNLYLNHTADVGALKLNGRGSGMDANEQPLTNAGRWMEALLQQDEWTDLGTLGYDTAVTGSGEVLQKVRRLKVATGTAAGSTAVAATPIGTGWSSGLNVRMIDWANRVMVKVQITLSAGTASGVNRIILGKGESLSEGPLAEKGIGFQIDNLALKGIAHNGTSGTTVDLSTMLTPRVTVTLAIVSDGAVNCAWFVNGVEKGTSDACPARASAEDYTALQVEGSNGGDAGHQEILVHSIKVYVQQ